MSISGIDKVTRLVALFTLLLVIIFIGGGWLFHGTMNRSFEVTSRQVIIDQAQILRTILESSPGGPMNGWSEGDGESIRSDAELDRLELLDLDGYPLTPRPLLDSSPPLSDPLLSDLRLGITVIPEPIHERDELYQSLYLPLRGPSGNVEGILAVESGARVSRQIQALRRGLWIATLLGALFIVFVLTTMTAILRRARTDQLELDRAEHLARIGTLAAGLAHEIRNPLAIIAGNAELMEMGAPSERDVEKARDILEEIGRLERLVSDFLDFARPTDLKLDHLDPVEIWGRTVEEMRARHPGIEFTLVQEGEIPGLRGDPDRLRQLTLNLLANAATVQGGRGEVAVRLIPQGERLRTVVSDRGPGVPEELARSLFRPFVSGREGGTGLGLAICRSVARAHGGDLRLTGSGPGGAEFTLILPLDPASTR